MANEFDIGNRILDALTEAAKAYGELETSPAEAASFFSGLDGCRNLIVLRVAKKTIPPPADKPEPPEKLAIKPKTVPKIIPSETKEKPDGSDRQS